MTVNVSAYSQLFTGLYSSTGNYESILPGGNSNQGDSYVTDWNALYNAAFTAYAPTPTETLYVSTTGSNSNSGTQGSPFLTIGYALSQLSGGGLILVADGTYDGADDWISDEQVAIPSGTSSQFTVIRAINVGRARIRMTSAPSAYTDGPINIQSGTSYVWIDGFVVEKTYQPAGTESDNGPYVAYLGGTHCKLTRCFVIASAQGRYSSAIVYTDGYSSSHNSYNVVEDCHCFGSFRYAIYGGSGGPDNTCGKSVVRRCTVFTPWYGSLGDPSAQFCFYGSSNTAYNHDSGGTNATIIGDCLFANCWGISSPNAYNTPNNCVWGTWYSPKNVKNVTHIGCGSVNCGSTWGAFASDCFGTTANALTYDSCMVINHDYLNSVSEYYPGNPRGFFNGTGGSSINVTNCVGDGLTSSNWIPVSRVNTSGNNFTGNLTTPIHNGTSYINKAIYAIGEIGQEYGVTGYNQVTTNRIFPFPYQSIIKEIYAETKTRGTYDVPTSISTSPNPLSGYALDGVTQQNMSDYLLESLGNQVNLTEVYA